MTEQLFYYKLGQLTVDILLVLIGIVVIIILYNKNKKLSTKNIHIPNRTYTEEIKILLNTENVIEKINNLLNDKIKEAADRYMIFNVRFNGEDAYLPQDTVDEMSKYVFGTVRSNITPAMRELIGLIYDVETDERLDSLIDINVKMYMLNEIVKTNKDIQE